jgi:hypothetical protein
MPAHSDYSTGTGSGLSQATLSFPSLHNVNIMTAHRQATEIDFKDFEVMPNTHRRRGTSRQPRTVSQYNSASPDARPDSAASGLSGISGQTSLADMHWEDPLDEFNALSRGSSYKSTGSGSGGPSENSEMTVWHAFDSLGAEDDEPDEYPPLDADVDIPDTASTIWNGDLVVERRSMSSALVSARGTYKFQGEDAMPLPEGDDLDNIYRMQLVQDLPEDERVDAVQEMLDDDVIRAAVFDGDESTIADTAWGDGPIYDHMSELSSRNSSNNSTLSTQYAPITDTERDRNTSYDIAMFNGPGARALWADGHVDDGDSDSDDADGNDANDGTYQLAAAFSDFGIESDVDDPGSDADAGTTYEMASHRNSEAYADELPGYSVASSSAGGSTVWVDSVDDPHNRTEDSPTQGYDSLKSVQSPGYADILSPGSDGYSEIGDDPEIEGYSQIGDMDDNGDMDDVQNEPTPPSAADPLAKPTEVYAMSKKKTKE